MKHDFHFSKNIPLFLYAWTLRLHRRRSERTFEVLVKETEIICTLVFDESCKEHINVTKMKHLSLNCSKTQAHSFLKR